ncbi:FRG domain-containing protein [Fibrobacter sp. UWOV1]|uniref:FRG domain-containing protein n=1 Tax=Fibrobacter sp. UWOV1 TaxID=1896215 RepID=UPI000914AD05|nr:FRG domain-containing protein [Fibrobacter sp. UWOV1]SHL02374.1 FRG domain-containing protein [Fibrobacter sp. UWOV1]
MKIGQYVREHLIPLLEKMNQEDFKQVLDNVSSGETKEIFGLHNSGRSIPFLELEGNMNDSLKRYYYTKNPIKRQDGKVYYLTSQWYEDQFIKIENWLSGYIKKYGLKKDVAEVKSLSEYLQWVKGKKDTNRDEPESLENFLANILQNPSEKSWIKKGLGDVKMSSRCFYRGHSKINYKLKSSVRRQDKYSEEILFKKFEAQFYDELRGKSVFEKLAVMQHHEYYSRLLDITENPLVALYFACKGNQDADDGVVYEFTSEISEVLFESDDETKFLAALAVLKQTDKNRLFYLVTNGVCRVSDFNFSLLKQQEKEEIKAILKSVDVTIRDDFNLSRVLYPRIVQPNSSLERIKRQSGLFVMDPLFEYNDEKKSSSLEFQMVFDRVKIPYTCKKDLLKELDSLCINEFTLFQNMDSFSKSTKMRG